MLSSHISVQLEIILSLKFLIVTPHPYPTWENGGMQSSFFAPPSTAKVVQVFSKLICRYSHSNEMSHKIIVKYAHVLSKQICDLFNLSVLT